MQQASMRAAAAAAAVCVPLMPYSSASACPLAVSTSFSLVMSHLLPTRILSTLSAACCSMLRIQLRMFWKLCSSVTS